MPSARARTAASVERFFQFSLLGLVTSGYLALAGSGYLDRATLILTLLGLAFRGAMISGLTGIEIPGRVASMAALAYVAFYPVDFYLISRDFLSATVHGVCFLAVVKILTATSNRDFVYTGAISFLELIAAAILSAQPGFFLYLAFYVVFAIAVFTSAEIRRGLQGHDQTVPPPRPRLEWRLGIVAAVATLGILLITAGLFLMVPRTARMAAMLLPNGPRLTGFSNVVDLGSFGRIARNDQAVMHVLSYSRPFPRNLKWRGAALSRFDGKRWFEPPVAATTVDVVRGTAMVADAYQRSRRDGGRLQYRVDVQNADTGTLFIAGIPEFVNVDAPRLLINAEDSVRVAAPRSESLRYEVSAHSGPPIAWPLRRADRTRYLQLPAVDLRIWDLARRWAGQGTQLEQALRIEHHLQKDFKYVLESSSRPVRDPLADFLFVRKQGYCEYFASSMAVMLRTLGIPSRVATGFQNGFFNEVSGLYVMRASDAHAWVEGWIEGYGWATFDPTPPAPLTRSAGLLSRLNMYMDAADNAWREWVVSYDLGHQLTIAANFESALRGLKRAGETGRLRWSAPVPERARYWGEWLAALAIVLLPSVIFAPRRFRAWRTRARIARISRGGGSPSDASVLYQRMLDLMERRGFRKPAFITPAEFAKHLPPEESRPVAAFTALYNSVRFGGESIATAQMAELLLAMDAPGRTGRGPVARA